jgi:hypothetical protein
MQPPSEPNDPSPLYAANLALALAAECKEFKAALEAIGRQKTIAEARLVAQVALAKRRFR